MERVLELYGSAHVDVHAHELKLVYQQLAESHLQAVNVDQDRKSILFEFSKKLLDRDV